MMRFLYRSPENNSLSITDVNSTRYISADGMLLFRGMDDIGIAVDAKTADKLTRSLYLEDRLDVSAYDCLYCEISESDDDDDEDDEDSMNDIDRFLSDGGITFVP